MKIMHTSKKLGNKFDKKKMVINLVKKKFFTGDLSGVYISTIVNETIKTNSNFFKKNFCNTKNTKLTNKIKTREY